MVLAQQKKWRRLKVGVPRFAGGIVCGFLVAGSLLAAAGEAKVYDMVEGSYIDASFPGYDSKSGSEYVVDQGKQAGTNGWYYGWLNVQGKPEQPTGEYILMPACASGFYRSAGWGSADIGSDYLAPPFIVVGSEAKKGKIAAGKGSGPMGTGGDGDRLFVQPFTGPGRTDCAVLAWRAAQTGSVDIQYFMRSTDSGNKGNHIQAFLVKWDGKAVTTLGHINVDTFAETYTELSKKGVAVAEGEEIQLFIGPKGNGSYDGALLYGTITLNLP